MGIKTDMPDSSSHMYSTVLMGKAGEMGRMLVPRTMAMRMVEALLVDTSWVGYIKVEMELLKPLCNSPGYL